MNLGLGILDFSPMVLVEPFHIRNIDNADTVACNTTTECVDVESILRNNQPEVVGKAAYAPIGGQTDVAI